MGFNYAEPNAEPKTQPSEWDFLGDIKDHPVMVNQVSTIICHPRLVLFSTLEFVLIIYATSYWGTSTKTFIFSTNNLS